MVECIRVVLNFVVNFELVPPTLVASIVLPKGMGRSIAFRLCCATCSIWWLLVCYIPAMFLHKSQHSQESNDRPYTHISPVSVMLFRGKGEGWGTSCPGSVWAGPVWGVGRDHLTLTGDWGQASFRLCERSFTCPVFNGSH